MQSKENQAKPCGSELHQKEQSNIMDNNNDDNKLLIGADDVINKLNKWCGKKLWNQFE